MVGFSSLYSIYKFTYFFFKVHLVVIGAKFKVKLTESKVKGVFN